MANGLTQLAQMDIRYFKAAFPVCCPYCGLLWDNMHPQANLYPHWAGTCGKSADADREIPKAGE